MKHSYKVGQPVVMYPDASFQCYAKVDRIGFGDEYAITIAGVAYDTRWCNIRPASEEEILKYFYQYAH